MAVKQAQFPGSPDTLKLKSEWTISMNGGSFAKRPTTATATVSFQISLPAGAKIKSAKVHAEWGNPNTGYNVRTINDVTAPLSGETDVTLTTTNGSFSVTFKFKAYGSTSGSYGSTHSGVASVNNIYLIVEYESGSVIYRAESGQLVGYELFHAENGQLVQYSLFHAENGQLVQY